MRVLVTGATGFIGSAVAQELLSSGHQVVGLARSDANAEAITAAGAEVHRGSLDDIESLKSGAENSDGVIHTAFIHDFSKMESSGKTDLHAVEAFGEVLAGSNRPLIVTSGVALLKPGHLGKETDIADAASAGSHRVPSELATVALAEKGVRSAVLRLPPSVHGEGDHGFVPFLIAIAREKGVSAYIEDGSNRWPAVHRLDAAHLYRLILENGAAGSHFHGIDDEGVPTREIAEIIGRRLNLPVVSKSREEAPDHFGWMTRFFGLDCPASSARTRALLTWSPTQPNLLADLDQPYYFG